MTPLAHAQAQAESSPTWWPPGSLVLRLMLVAMLAVAVSGVLSAWLASRASEREAIRRVVGQQTEEVEVMARLLASKIEQSQKVLRTVAEGITPEMLNSPSSLEWLLRQGLPAVQFFDSMQVARPDGELRVNLHSGRLEDAANLDPAERDALRRTLSGGKPLVSELVGGRTAEARVMFTMPLRREDGPVLGVVAGALKLHSQGLLPPSMTLPARDDSRLIVFTREGTILSHPDPLRLLGNVRDEAGLGPVYARWLQQAQPVAGRGTTVVQPAHIVSMAGMPLPQWLVARVSDSRAMMAPLEGAQRNAWWLAAAVMAASMALLAAFMVWMAQPLERLCHSALQLAHGVRSDAIQWPRATGEVGTLVKVFEGQVQQSAQQHQQRAQLEGQLQAILDNASVGIVITRQGILEVVGRQACQMLGYCDEELHGRPARTLYASDADYQRLGERVQDAFRAHGAFDEDVCFMRKDGSPVWARVQGRGVRADDMAGGTVWILEDMTAAREAQQQQDWAAVHDPLTQLCNRDAFVQRMGVLLAERSARARTPGTATVDAAAAGSEGDGVMLFLDLDHFTVVNDVAGHDAGDDVLRHVARLVESQVRQIGWAARLGGDEFAVVLPGCSLTRGQVVAEQLRAAVQAWEPSYQGRSFTLGVSIGLVVLDASLQDVPSVLYAADMACYDAKRAGRNRVETRHASQAAASGRMPLGPV
ncbi:sensor domain-containing diguanylate cyclase [Acidovorax carolinensis]|uniref:Sensor domain-containing diguanylate cyclase n=1 Tax=Acidovorax carolinensis TaxID=553814 RepID=A0A240U9Y2_9BURK|nr:diguanylate cyclase [Acidovorax carolinensis]ART55814.1 sensor domain-containing diguanylate cyclase [Acidovorax carolinensis]ART58304.1 sensor domain-containing diguanylate cyclase [Acidovorax carolinensis]